MCACVRACVRVCVRACVCVVVVVVVVAVVVVAALFRSTKNPVCIILKLFRRVTSMSRIIVISSMDLQTRPR